MVKKIGILIFVLLLAGGGFFYRQNNQKDVQALNKSLPTGVKVAKSIFGFGSEYKVINKIDGYEFKVPLVWRGVSEIKYTPERTEEGYIATSIFIAGKESETRTMSVDIFKVNNDENLKQWTEKFTNSFGFIGTLEEKTIKGSKIIKIAKDLSLGPYMFFLKINSKIYMFSGGSEEFIREIISNGKW